MAFTKTDILLVETLYVKRKFVSVLMNRYTTNAHGGMNVYLTWALYGGEFTLHVPDSSNSLREGSP